ncbi:MAG TPA: hypothetical protein VGT05_01695 [Patescibacteria group bacterium]|nr:hypothetical protein [Patescibacteria group bacterium]
MLADFITSKSRIKLISVFLEHPYEMFHVRELVRRTGDEINAVRRELSFLEGRGILQKEKRANRVYYFLSKSYSYYPDLLRLAVKSTGLGGAIMKNRAKLGKIKYAMFAGRYAKEHKKYADDVDFLIVGTVVIPELSLLVRNEEARIGGEINYTVMSEDEFQFRKERHDPFLGKILVDARIMLIGDEESLLA